MAESAMDMNIDQTRRNVAPADVNPLRAGIQGISTPDAYDLPLFHNHHFPGRNFLGKNYPTIGQRKSPFWLPRLVRYHT
jgi:hypothetical protein